MLHKAASKRQPLLFSVFVEEYFFISHCAMPGIRCVAHFGKISLMGFARKTQVFVHAHDITSHMKSWIAALAPQCATQRMLHQLPKADSIRNFSDGFPASVFPTL